LYVSPLAWGVFRLLLVRFAIAAGNLMFPHQQNVSAIGMMTKMSLKLLTMTPALVDASCSLK
jgi:hypothetical protein